MDFDGFEEFGSTGMFNGGVSNLCGDTDPIADDTFIGGIPTGLLTICCNVLTEGKLGTEDELGLDAGIGCGTASSASRSILSSFSDEQPNSSLIKCHNNPSLCSRGNFGVKVHFNLSKNIISGLKLSLKLINASSMYVI